MAITFDSLITMLQHDLGVEVAEINKDTLLFSSGILDSFSLVNVLDFLEREGGLRVDPIDVTLENLDSIERMLAYVGRASA